MNPIQENPIQENPIQEAREWLMSCDWPDMEPEDIEELSDEEIIRAVKRHYDGGWTAFLDSLA